MARQTYQLGADGRIVIEGCRGDLEINGGDRENVEISGDRSLQGRVSESDGEIIIRGYNGDLELRVARHVTIVGRRIDGDVTIDDVADVELDRIGGDVEAKDVLNFRANQVGGDLDLAAQGGQVEIERVGGDLRVENAGTLRVEAVGGDAELVDIDQLFGLGRVGGDLEFRWSGKLGEPVTGMVGGDARIELGPDAAIVLLATVGGDISGDGPEPALRAEAHEVEDYAATPAGGSAHGWDLEAGGGRLTVTFGDGGHELHMTVGGDLELHGGRVTNSSFHGIVHDRVAFGDFGIGDEMRRLARDLKAMGRDLARDISREVRHSTRTERGGRPRIAFAINDKAFQLDAEQIERVTREARDAAASGIAMAQEAVERALVNMAAASRAARPGGHRPPQPPRPPAPARPGSWTGQTVRIEREAPPAPQRAPEEVESERLAILRMVSEGRLGIDEAEMMLRALEDRV